jgi:hypothetical protein
LLFYHKYFRVYGFLVVKRMAEYCTRINNWSHTDKCFTPDNFKKQVNAATTTNVASLSGTPTIDGVTLIVGDLILVKNQTTGTQNGIYMVTGNTGNTWTRTIDTCLGAQLLAVSVYVLSGTVNGGTQWVCSNTTIPYIGTDNIIFNPVLASPAIVASGDLLAQTGTVTIASYTVTALGCYEVKAYINISALTSKTVELTVNYYDETNTSRSQVMITTDINGNPYFPSISVAGNFISLAGIVRASGSVGTPRTISVVATVTGTGSATFDAGARILSD